MLQEYSGIPSKDTVRYRQETGAIQTGDPINTRRGRAISITGIITHINNNNNNKKKKKKKKKTKKK